MTISYNWLHDYLPGTIEPAELSRILTSIGLEVESFEPYESIKGSLAGLVIGHVLEVNPHPNADKLKVTHVDTGDETLQIVCGAPNVAVGQKVVVAKVGSTIYPKNGDPLTMKIAKIRGVESYGMICAEDEIGLSEEHGGIMVLNGDVSTGSPASEYFKPVRDHIYEIGLTPNRMDAMSHLGVARDVCAFLTHHHGKSHEVKTPFKPNFKPDSNELPIEVKIENPEACRRYSGVSISGVEVKESPDWLKDKLRSIGQRPINNIVDITNFILHETGQPLHAFDIDAIKDNQVRVKNLAEGSVFITLDEKERKLSRHDLMICNGADEGMCIAGVFGGKKSGVTPSTTKIFLESAWFNPIDIRRTSFRHGLRTDAATRFEKNVDISNTANVVARAASLIKEIAGGKIASELVDVYANPKPKQEVSINSDYLQKLSGKRYSFQAAAGILVSLGFEILESGEVIKVKVPYSKPDISLPADLVEEIMRIDGYDNIEIPSSINITPSVEPDAYKQNYREKVANYLVGQGFNEIFTNSITNSGYFPESDLQHTVRMLNNLSVAHNIMRPSMLETGLEAVAYNLNRKNTDLQFFEFGKTYRKEADGKYSEFDHLCLYITGHISQGSWKNKAGIADLYYLKGIIANVLKVCAYNFIEWSPATDEKLQEVLTGSINEKRIILAGKVSREELNRFDIKQDVFFADISWDALLELIGSSTIIVKELPKQLPVYRDLAIVVPKTLKYGDVKETADRLQIRRLKEMKLFDVFESEKLGKDKKSLAISFTFLDEEKTMTDKEIDEMMIRLMNAMEKDHKAEIRK